MRFYSAPYLTSSVMSNTSLLSFTSIPIIKQNGPNPAGTVSAIFFPVVALSRLFNFPEMMNECKVPTIPANNIYTLGLSIYGALPLTPYPRLLCSLGRSFSEVDKPGTACRMVLQYIMFVEV